MSENIPKRDLLRLLEQILEENKDLVPDILDLRINKKGFYTIGIMQGQYHGVQNVVLRILYYVRNYKGNETTPDDFDEEEMAFRFPND